MFVQLSLPIEKSHETNISNICYSLKMAYLIRLPLKANPFIANMASTATTFDSYSTNPYKRLSEFLPLLISTPCSSDKGNIN